MEPVPAPTPTPVPPPAPPGGPGWRTSEFALIGAVVGSFLAGFGWITTHQANDLTTGVVQAVTGLAAIWAVVRIALGYADGRVALKSRQGSTATPPTTTEPPGD